MTHTALAIPTSGTGRRRAKAIRNRRRAHALENDLAVAAGRLPPHTVALSVCTCGRVSWLEEGATTEERNEFDRAADDHAAVCGDDR